MEQIVDELKQFGLNKINFDFDINKKYMLIKKKNNKIYYIQFLGKYKSSGISMIDYVKIKYNNTYFFELESSMIACDTNILLNNLYEIDDYFDNKIFWNIIYTIINYSKKNNNNIIEVICTEGNIRIESYEKQPKEMKEWNIYNNDNNYDIEDEFWFFY